MAKGRFGSFYGTAAAGTDMIAEFKKKADLIHKPILATGFVVSKIAISGDPGVEFTLNGNTVVLPSTGIFETAIGMIDIESLIFKTSAKVNILYMY